MRIYARLINVYVLMFISKTRHPTRKQSFLCHQSPWGHSITTWTRRGGGVGVGVGSVEICRGRGSRFCLSEWGGGQNWVNFGPRSC